MGAQVGESKTPQDTLSLYFDNSVTTVQQAFASFEKNYVIPIVELLKASFFSYPIPFVFFSTFVALSLFPVLAFFIILVATLSTALTLALCLALAFSTGVFLFLGGILLVFLGSTFLLSGFLTAFALSAYLSGRLVFILRRFGRNGFRPWSQEVAYLFFPSSARPTLADEDPYASEDSGVSVGRGVKDGLTAKTEPVLHERPYKR
ncbi:hypothetical protein B0F90DRAFT_1666784 [Multifurca ochricompacta]|uniref:Uncharacterized protein n=1 Tax=Multifurca ochricompacta TaxID=376703 RepID=A0AAD4QP86_9AGAM|nr:hypothetical protein B0F90DRAFT_1666784 [Multifurca ochricompacta]